MTECGRFQNGPATRLIIPPRVEAELLEEARTQVLRSMPVNKALTEKGQIYDARFSCQMVFAPKSEQYVPDAQDEPVIVDVLGNKIMLGYKRWGAVLWNHDLRMKMDYAIIIPRYAETADGRFAELPTDYVERLFAAAIKAAGRSDDPEAYLAARKKRQKEAHVAQMLDFIDNAAVAGRLKL